MSDTPDPASISDMFHLAWNTILTAVTAGLGLFLKRTLDKIDSKAEKSDIAQVRTEISQLRTDFQQRWEQVDDNLATEQQHNDDKHHANLTLMNNIRDGVDAVNVRIDSVLSLLVGKHT